MTIAETTRHKHGVLLSLLQRVGWSQAELSRQSGVRGQTIGEIINLQRRPSQKEADAIQKAIASKGEYFDVLEQWAGIQDEETESLTWCNEALTVESPSSCHGDLSKAIDSVLETLRERERLVLELRFFDNLTLQQIADKWGINRERVRQIEARALRCLHHPSRVSKLISFV